MFETNRDFLSWLGGYFDHGSCCKARERMMRGYPTLGINIVIYVDSEEVATEIRDFFSFEGAKVKPSGKPGKKWRFEIRAIHEALSFAYQLLPHVKIRKTDLEKVITTINQWADNRLGTDVYVAGTRAMVEKVLDIRAMHITGKLHHEQ